MLYNHEIKQRFLDLYENESTRINYERILTKAADTERMLNKDLAEFNIEEIKDVMFNLNPPSFTSAQSYGRIITKYIDWGISEGLRRNNINPLKAKEPSYFEQFIDKSKDIYLTEKELRQFELEIVNPQDVALIRLIFEGVGGKNLREIANLKKSDVNYVDGTLHLIDADGFERTIKVEDITLKYIDMASRQVIYTKNNGIENINNMNKNEQTLIDNEFVFRPVFTRVSDPYRPIASQVLYRRVRNLKLLLEYMKIDAIKYLNTTNLTHSGMIYMAKKILVEDGGVFNKRKQYRLIMDRFKIKTQGVLSRFLTEDLIYDLYGDDIENEINNTHS